MTLKYGKGIQIGGKPRTLCEVFRLP